MARAPSRSHSEHRWRFFRAGGVDQVRLDSGEDIVRLGELDQKLWVALSCPAKGLEFDERTLELLDTDGDGRVRAPEILAAVKWVGACLKNPDDLIGGNDTLALDRINERTPEGKLVLAASKHILANLGKKEATEIALADAGETVKVLATARLNGDGIVPPDTVRDAAASQVATEIVTALGGEMDRSGKLGFNETKLEQFFKELEARDAWWKESEVEDKSLRPLGAHTDTAYAALQAVSAKVDDYFMRCRVAAFDARAQAALNREEKIYAELATQTLTAQSEEIAALPLSHVEGGRALPLKGTVNPYWAPALDALLTTTVQPLLGKTKESLSEAEWTDLRGRFANFEAWLAKKPASSIELLGIARVREILGSQARELLAAAVAEDLGAATKVDAITDAERLIRYRRDLHRLLKNYVSFEEFYSRSEHAVFQAGRLYLDGRSCDLCVRVDDVAKHGVLAALAKTYLAYVDCTRRGGTDKMTIAAAFTAGDSDHLIVGRNGIFYDRKGQDWDATITKIVENPISIGQAFWSPYKRVLRGIEQSVAKRAAAADEAATAKLSTAAALTGDAAKTGKAPEKPRFDVGVVAALGVAVGGITAALGVFVQAFFGLGMWMPLGVLGVLLLISGPSMAIAWMKLRQRNLGPILDANGWAVNGRAKVNIPLGGALTEIAELPAGCERSLVDPFAPKKRRWPKILLTLIVFGLAWWGLHQGDVLQRFDWYNDFVTWVRDVTGNLPAK